MPMENVVIKTVGKDSYVCDIPVTEAEWLEMLRDRNVIRPEWLKVLLSFYFMPGHKATCFQCAQQYGFEINRYNSGISALGKSVVRHLGRFRITDSDGHERFWPVAIGLGKVVGSKEQPLFEWTLRPELVGALRTLLIKEAVAEYSDAFEENFKKEEYKWRAVKWFQEHWHEDDADFASMFEFATAKTQNLLASASSYPRGMIMTMAKVDTSAVREMFKMLYDESLDLEYRVTDFINRAEEIRMKRNPEAWKMHFQSTNTVSIYLWLRYPDKYTIYKARECQKVIGKLGLDYNIKLNGKASEMIKGMKVYDVLRGYLSANTELVDKVRNVLNSNPELYPDPELRTLAADFGFWISRYYDSAEESLYLKKKITMTPFISEAAGLLRSKKNLILQGAPGTGKTYNTASLALALIDGTVPENHGEVMLRYEELRKSGRIGFITFHQSMDYEDFIEGIKPCESGGTVSYTVEDGIFKRLCNAAGAVGPDESDDKPFILIIDEINRGNVSKIFGELITLLEKDKRLGAGHPLTVTLPYSKTPFGVPGNLYIVGTMNTTDRSTGTIDYAVRRRFRFITLPADRDVINDERARSIFDDVRRFIEKHRYADIDMEDLMVGHSYFMADDDSELLMNIKYEVVPLLKEYIRDGIISIRPDEADKYFAAWQNLTVIGNPDPTDGDSEGTSEV